MKRRYEVYDNVYIVLIGLLYLGIGFAIGLLIGVGI